ncbi:MAG: transcription-repair coupling factor [Synergistaceae bacterium]
MRAWIFREFKNIPLLVVLPDERQASNFVADASTLGIFDEINFLPEITFSDDQARQNATKISRGVILEKSKHSNSILVATPSSLMAPFAINDYSYDIAVGDVIKRDSLCHWLTEHGYQNSDIVWSAGQFTIRGSIIDIFSPSDFYPTRIEFYDDEIESIRYYNSETQKSSKTFPHTKIISILSKKEHRISSFLDDKTRIIFFDPKSIENTAENYYWLWNALEDNLKSSLELLDWDTVFGELSKFKRIRIVPDVYSAKARFTLSTINSFRAKREVFTSYITKMQSEGYKINISTETEKNIEWAKLNNITFKTELLSEGFLDPEDKIIYLSDLELSGVSLSHHKISYRAPSDWGKSFTIGQWVVHDDYGVGKYLGTTTLNRNDEEYEYLILEYAFERRLLIPVLQVDKILPWSTIRGEEPKPDNLKSNVWKKNSEKAKELAEKAAKDLINIYAKREIQKGYKFKENAILMSGIEKSFPYTETRDQLNVLEEIYKDMESDMPMDRLLVGDVGFGKTEIALRASAKAVFDGKQVAIMVPTTLLAHQHFETFSIRFADTAIIVAVVSRFVAIKKQKQILENLKDGKIDIIIGTHRLVSQDVQFKDLGLVVIDEEHRFGVMNKEHLKHIAPNVDVLTLSATPIPRSLSMSLSGLRDISVLQTPPSRRLPVITVVRPWSDDLFKKAILNEINRGGQVFFVHNRVKDIQTRVLMIKRMFPKLKISVIHSKMQETEIERNMFAFEKKELDILVATTIIESGLDIPTANTLIVDDAHELGLAQMYQLRGRVGRSEEQAFAFLMYPPEVNLTNEAIERLDAIAELDELGAGYQLAQRDLQIRGGGELLGLSQHGNIMRIGYSKYCELLSEEIAKLKGKNKYEPEINIEFSVAIPSYYIPQESIRITLYRRISKITMVEEVRDLLAEITDRFGKVPSQVLFMLDLASLRLMAYEFGIKKILVSKLETIIVCNDEENCKPLRLNFGWSKRVNGYIGPGGYQGINEFNKIIKNDIYNIC